MFPARFRYVAPRTLDEAVDILERAAGDAKVLAGGQSLIPMLKLRFANPHLLVDINNVTDISSEHAVDSQGVLHIGGLVRHAHLERSALLPGNYPLLAAVAPLVADPLVRNRGTLVGSICHADPRGDWAAAAIALDGSVVAYGPRGKRSIAAADFVTGQFQNALSYDEIAVEVTIPKAQGTRLGGFIKMERRVGDFATAGAAVSLELSGDTVLKAGVALTGVGAATLNATGAAAALAGRTLSADAISAAATAAAEIADPETDHRGSASYKRHLIQVFVTRILTNIVHDQERAAGKAAA